MLTEVTHDPTPFSSEWLDQLDGMSKPDALIWINKHIEHTIQVRDRYEKRLKYGAEFIHAYCIECNNIIRYQLLYHEVESEE